MFLRHLMSSQWDLAKWLILVTLAAALVVAFASQMARALGGIST